MLELLISSIYLILPAYFANMCPVFAGKLGLPLGQPINEKMFGKNKTWRGFYAGFIGALLVLTIQTFLAQSGYMTSYSILDYTPNLIPIYAFALGIGAITGDSIKSFFKRRLKIKAGAPWIPFDQIDFILGAILFLSPLYLLSWKHFLVLILITPFLHFLANIIGYVLGLKKVWW